MSGASNTEEHSSSRPLILTLKMDDDSQALFNRLRERHFPKKRNFIPAHVSLFNQLPGDRLESIVADVEEVCRANEPLTLRVERLLFLGKGVAYRFEGSELEAVRETLADKWRPWLSDQDLQGSRPHVTVQNKVSPEKARELHGRLEASFTPFEVRGEGLLLWRYLGGPWEPVGEYLFGG